MGLPSGFITTVREKPTRGLTSSTESSGGPLGSAATGSGSVVEQTVAQTTLTENSEGWHVWSVSVELGQVGSYEVKASATAPEGTTFEDKIINIG